MNQEDLRGNPVLALQYMLRELGNIYDFLPNVPLDGVFSDSTLEAVLQFQKELFPPATGVVDQSVWEAIRNEYISQQENIKKPRVLRAYPEGGDHFEFGEERGEIAIFQLMFQVLSTEIVGIKAESPSGVFTETLRDNLMWLQSNGGLLVTGEFDPITWDRLARLYELYVTKV